MSRFGRNEAEQGNIEMPEEPVPRRMKITKGALHKHGCTKACPGCKAVLQGEKVLNGLSEKCSLLIENELKNYPSVERTRKRAEDFLEKALEHENAEDSKDQTERKVDHQASIWTSMSCRNVR